MITTLKKIIFKYLAARGYRLVRLPEKTEILSNVFGKNHRQTALLSYIRSVFDTPENRHDRRHTNRYTTFLIAEVLSELGYNVDVIDYSDEQAFDYRKYQLVLGLGKPMDYVLQARQADRSTRVIWFGTGCNPLFSNAATLGRVVDFYQRHQRLLLSSSRYIREDWPLQHEVADWTILHGREFARATYTAEKVSSIHAPVFMYHDAERTDQEWEEARNHYIWFGVGGLIHKGLDLVLDAFKTRGDCHLHICGNIEQEQDFFDHYSTLIGSQPNITYHGFMDVSTEAFASILKNCAFVIFPSASEGNSPSVITCMANGGLIPLVTRNADVDLNGYGLHIEALTVEAVTAAIDRSRILTTDELRSQSAKIRSETRRLNSFEYFKQDFKQKLGEALSRI